MITTNKIWLTWHFATRSRNLAKELNLELFEYFENSNLLKRHFYSSLWTIKILVKERPKIIVIQLSFLLLILVVIYKIVSLGRVIIIADCHTKALRRKARGRFNFVFWPIKKFTFRFVDLAIVSNIGMSNDIEELNKNFIILPDKIPEENIVKQNSTEKYCVYISAFAVDEPFEEIFKVAKLLEEELKIYWTGKKPKSLVIPENKPKNLIFTDYLSFEDYFNLIGNANCILALTTENDCLQSGAYEALNVEVPMVISNTNALKDYFASAAIYTNHTPDEIAEKILLSIDKSEELIEKIKRVKELRKTEFTEKIQSLRKFIN